MPPRNSDRVTTSYLSEGFINGLGLVAAIVLAVTYTISLFNRVYSSPPFAHTSFKLLFEFVLSCAPTIPVLFLFSFLPLNFLSLKIRADKPLQFLSMASIMSFIVFFTAILLVSVNPFVIFMFPGSVVVFVLSFILLNINPIPKVLVSLGLALLTYPWIGSWVVAAYQRIYQERRPLISLPVIDTLLLLMFFLICVTHFFPRMRKISVLFNIFFIVSTIATILYVINF